MGLDLKLLDGFIHHPILVLKPTMLVTGFPGPIGAGVQIDSRLPFLVGSQGADFLGAAFIRIDGNLPALHGVTGVGFLVHPDQTLLLVVPGIHNSGTGFHDDIMEAQFRCPVRIFRWQLQHDVPPGSQIFCADKSGIVSGIFADDFSIGILHPECPSTQEISRIGGFFNLDAPQMGVCEGNFRSLTNGDGHRFYGGVHNPVGIIRRQFLGIVSAGGQAGNGNSTVCTRCKGRARNWLGAGSIRIHPDFPTAYVFSGTGNFYQLETTGVQLVMEADRGGATAGDGDFLGIGTGAGVACLDTAVSVTQLFDIVGTSS